MTNWTLDLGASVRPGEGVFFRVWAPAARAVEVEVYGGQGSDSRCLTPEPHPPIPDPRSLTPDGDGFFAGLIPGLGAEARYRYRLNGGASFPDPCSRFQPEGPHGPSEVVDPSAYEWHDQDWPGLAPEGLVIYELHVGTFTPEGTFEALIGQLDELKSLGVTAIELMPVAEFPGRWNWGYDGVDLYAPSHVYGRPEGLRRLVDAAHQRGLGVLLDVVYNHLGPDGNYLRCFSPDYFTNRYQTPWGEALNYDGPNSRWVRHFIVQNARYWLAEYHLDGLRLDATHAIFDESPVHILGELAGGAEPQRRRDAEICQGEKKGEFSAPLRLCGSGSQGPRGIIIAEDSRNDVRLIDPPARGGFGLDGGWADDFHHALHVFLTGEHDGYYRDYRGTLAEVAGAIERGFLYQGERSIHWGGPRGTRVTDQPARSFVFCLQNHDQVGNRAFGERLSHLVDRARYHVASALLLLVPETPLLFMGQEFAASSPFLYFTDHVPELGRLVTAGRRGEFAAFDAFRDPARRGAIPDPQAEATFRRSKLDLGERARHADVYRLYLDLLTLRRQDRVLSRPDRQATRAAELAPALLAVHRWHGEAHRLILANFGEAVHLDAREHPWLQTLPPTGWQVLWASAAERYGGAGEAARLSRRPASWQVDLPPRSAVVLARQ